MARTRELKVKITGDERDLARAFGKADSSVSKWGSRLKSFGKVAAFGLAGAGVAAVKFGVDFVKAAEESVAVGKDTEAVIKSMGGVAKVSARQVSDLAESLSLKAGVDDELIQTGQNLLLTFGNIRNEVGKGNDIFNQASQVMVDFAARFKTDIPGAAKLVGKALNDPIRGLTALQRVGVQFTEQQREQITAMVESGDIMGAQKLIMAELTRETAGAAEAQATATGKLSVAFGNLAEKIGLVLLPYVEDFSDWMVAKGIPLIETKLIPKIQELAEWVRDTLVPAIRDDWLPAMQDIASFLNDTLVPAVEGLGGAFLGLDGNVKGVIATFGIFTKVVGITALGAVLRFVGQAVAGIAGVTVTVASFMLSVLALPATFVIAAVAFVRNFGTIRNFAASVAGAIGRFFAALGSRLAGIFAAIGRAGANAAAAVGRFFAALPGRIAGYVGAIGRAFASLPGIIGGIARRAADGFVRAIRGIPGRIAGIAGDILSKLPSPGGGVPFIPGIAKGGIITRSGVQYMARGGFNRRGTDTVPAMLTPREAVLTMDDQRALFGAIRGGRLGGGTVVNVNIGTLIGDDRQIQRKIEQAVNRGLAAGSITKRGRPL